MVNGLQISKNDTSISLPEILLISSYPPRECGIATYSDDLVKALNKKFNHSFTISICPLESENEVHQYPAEIKYRLNTDEPGSFMQLAKSINGNEAIRIVMLQHEFGFFEKNKDDLLRFLEILTKPVVIAFHTVLPNPGDSLKENVQQMVAAATSIIVMTNSSLKILTDEYELTGEKITVIPHGTHLVPHVDRELLKKKYKLEGKKILSTFGLLSSGKSIETTLEALPAIIEKDPDTLFLIIGKTHPSVIKKEGEKYRNMLAAKVVELKLQEHVRFINQFLPLPDLLDYLQLTDIYLFTSINPAQAVSGTFSYAMSCGCAVISTPIPHAKEVLQNGAGIIIDFKDSKQLSDAVTGLLNDEHRRSDIGAHSVHRMASTAWENTAIAHALLFEKIEPGNISLHYTIPPINLDHIKELTTDFGMIQFSTINRSDISSGYTLDDNARAMIAMCQHYELTRDETNLQYITTYYNFIKYCLQTNRYFLNYVNEQKEFTEQNNTTNLEDANGRAIWALGYLISISHLLPAKLTADAASTMQMALVNINKTHSTRAMAFVIKGLYYRNTKIRSVRGLSLIRQLANRLVQMYRHESGKEWLWFESYLTYANSILPEALLCAWLATGEMNYKEVAKASFDFLLSKTFSKDYIKVISNKNWLYNGEETLLLDIGSHQVGGEQPIDVAYTVIALSKFQDVFKEDEYEKKMEVAFNWFLGANHLQQIIYNPCTGGCYDGLEGHYVNLNQGAESTVSYLMARLTVEKAAGKKQLNPAQPAKILNQEQEYSGILNT
jgi:glycosyltransferase involved in cell wall biosynthesis